MGRKKIPRPKNTTMCTFFLVWYKANPRKNSERGVYQVAFHHCHQYSHSSQPGVVAVLEEGAAATASFTSSLVAFAATTAYFAASAAARASILVLFTTFSNPEMSGRTSI